LTNNNENEGDYFDGYYDATVEGQVRLHKVLVHLWKQKRLSTDICKQIKELHRNTLNF